MSPYEWALVFLGLGFSLWWWFGPLDRIMNQWLMNTLTGGWQGVMGVLGWAGQGAVQATLCLWMGTHYYFRNKYACSRVWFMALPVYAVVGIGLTWPLKVIFGRSRPKLWHGEGIYDLHWFEFAARFQSYPSGHTMTSFALVAAIWNLYGPLGRTFWMLLAILTGFGRAGLGSHWPSDVFAGAALGWLGGRFLAHVWKLRKNYRTE